MGRLANDEWELIPHKAEVGSVMTWIARGTSSSLQVLVMIVLYQTFSSSMSFGSSGIHTPFMEESGFFSYYARDDP